MNMSTNMKKNLKEKMKLLFIKRYKFGFSVIVGTVLAVSLILQTSIGFCKDKVSKSSVSKNNKKETLVLKIDQYTDEKTRYKMLLEYFSPSFDQVLEFDRSSKENQNALRAEDLSGYIFINPPKGHCFRITFDEDKPDRTICDRTSVRWRLSDIDDQGKLNWLIALDDSSSRFKYSWKSVYKFAKISPSVKDSFMQEKKYPILGCQADIDTRKITLDMFFTKWFISFPPVDIRAKEYETVYENFENYEDKLVWILRDEKSFGLDPDMVKVDDLPSGAYVTRCRYLRKEPESRFNNSLECHHIGLYDVLRVPLDCLERLNY